MIFAADILGAGEGAELAKWLVGLSASVFLLNQVLTFFKQHMREQPAPASTYVTIPNFEKIEAERKADRQEIKNSLKEIKEDMLESNKYQARARQQIHRRVNGMENALSFIAGRFAHDGDHQAAAAIEAKLHNTGGTDDV